MEMKKQAMNCAFAAVQEELLRQTAAFYRSCAVFLCMFFFLETRLKCQWDLRFSSPGKDQLHHCHVSPPCSSSWYPAAYPKPVLMLEGYRKPFPASLLLFLTTLEISNFLPCPPLSDRELCSLPLPGSLSLYTRLVMLLICVLCNVQPGQSCWNSILTKSRQAQVNVNTPNSLLFFFLSFFKPDSLSWFAAGV